jgi:hypothetical protein
MKSGARAGWFNCLAQGVCARVVIGTSFEGQVIRPSEQFFLRPTKMSWLYYCANWIPHLTTRDEFLANHPYDAQLEQNECTATLEDNDDRNFLHMLPIVAHSCSQNPTGMRAKKEPKTFAG